MLILVIVLGTIFYIALYLNKSNSKKSRKEINNEFWEKERKANLTRPKDLSDITYIKIPVEDLPFVQYPEDKELEEIQEAILSLAESPIANFTGISNTDLKLKYGPANINDIMSYDDNFTSLSNLLYEWGHYYYNQEDFDNARQILEYAVSCKCDVSQAYILLAEIYLADNQYDKIEELIEIASSLNTLSKESLINSLKEIGYSSFLQ